MASRMHPLEWLRALGAQGDVIDGLARIGATRDWQTLWSECPRGDWLLGIAERLGVDHVALVRAAIGCARTADAGPDAARLLDVAERWTRGDAAASEVAEATRILEQAASPLGDPALEAATRAALAVGYGVEDRAALASAPAAAAESAIVAAMTRGDVSLEFAMRRAHDACASAVRAAVPWQLVAPCVARFG
jgi:hypothetical protein